MWRPFAQTLDRLAIRSASGSVLPSPDGQTHIPEALDLLTRPYFFTPQVEPAVMAFHGKNKFTFPSPTPDRSVDNNRVPGRCELVGKDWQERPSIILLHGWNAELQYRWFFPFWAQLLAQAGINAFMFELPLHGARRPKQPGEIKNFLSGDLLHVMSATHQALADTRALALWLRSQGTPWVGLWGVSLGAWLAGLAAAHQREIDLAVLLTPVVRMDRALRDLPFCAAIREELQGVDEQFQLLNLVSHEPRLRSDRLLVVAPEWDLFAPRETLCELSAAWRTETWWLPHGHISALLASGIMRRIATWVATAAVNGGTGLPASGENKKPAEVIGGRRKRR